MKNYEYLNEKTIISEKIYDGKLLHIKKDTVKLSNGNKSVREYFNHVGASCVVAITDDNEIIIEKQFRYPFKSVITEIPAGKLDSKSEDPLLAAKRELKEETGYTAKRWTYMGDFYPSVAYTDECIRMYLAQDLYLGDAHLDDDELIEIEKIPFKEFIQDVMDGKIKDGKTIAAVLKANNIINN